MRRIIATAGVAVAGFFPLEALGEGVTRTILSFSDLAGWADDDHAEALATFRVTCGQIKAKGWKGVCANAEGAKNARAFFEKSFVPVLITDGKDPLFTGYYEPELPGSRVRTARFQHPLYKKPPEMKRGKTWFSRAEIEGDGLLQGRGLEIAWLEDPVEAFFVHVQGSVRLRLTDGSAMRVGFSAKNGHKYRSVGKEMERLGLLPSHRLSAEAIKAWVRDNPGVGKKVLWHNPSFIFFREITGLPDKAGPIGSMSRPVTAMRSIAVDKSVTPLGAPVWVEKQGKAPFNRLMIAQDTGSAIKGAQRADVFYGSGEAAGNQAGIVRDAGRMVVLMPKGLIAGGQ